MIQLGYIAEKVFDCVVFIQNEFWKYCKCNADIEKIIKDVCTELNIDIMLLLKAIYVNLVLTIVWNIEDNEDMRVIKNNLEYLDIISGIIAG